MLHMHSDRRRDVLAHLGSNLKRLRTDARMSQTALAERAGISRRTIINIESGEANISLSAVDDLAHALGATFVDLVAEPTTPRSDIGAVAWRGAQPGSEAVLLGTAPAAHEAQLWTWSLGPGERYDAQPDPAGWHELLYVVDGCLTLTREHATTRLDAGGHAVYSSAQRYSYANEGDAVSMFVRIVVS